VVSMTDPYGRIPCNVNKPCTVNSVPGFGLLHKISASFLPQFQVFISCLPFRRPDSSYLCTSSCSYTDEKPHSV
jgi:hypothetical protein